jgi:hypothetical protein
VYCFNVSKNDTKYTWKAEIKSVPDFKCISPKQINNIGILFFFFLSINILNKRQSL